MTILSSCKNATQVVTDDRTDDYSNCSGDEVEILKQGVAEK